MEGFEIEYFTDFGTGPRYSVDVESGEVLKDDLFMHGEGPISDSDVHYPGEADAVVDVDAAEEAYEQILDSGLEPGHFHVHRDGDRNFRVAVYGDESEEVEEVDEDLIYDAVEGLEGIF